jgi:hypothetical protein
MYGLRRIASARSAYVRHREAAGDDELLGELLGRLGVLAVPERDGRTVSGQATRDRPTDAAARTGHQGHTRIAYD